MDELRNRLAQNGKVHVERVDLAAEFVQTARHGGFKLVVGIAGHSNLRQVGRMGVRALIYFEVVTTFALLIGINPKRPVCIRPIADIRVSASLTE